VVRCDALIVGGGPAGSTCARFLTRAGWHVVVIDRARFPRDKVCAGWVTPGVFRLLELDPEAYRATGLTDDDFHRVHLRTLRTPAIRPWLGPVACSSARVHAFTPASKSGFGS